MGKYYYFKTCGYTIGAPISHDYIKNFTNVDMVLLGSINDSHVLWSSPLYKDAQYKGLLDVDMGKGNGISPYLSSF